MPTVVTHRITPTLRVRGVQQDTQTLLLREELRKLPGGYAWCILGASIVTRKRRLLWPVARVAA